MLDRTTPDLQAVAARLTAELRATATPSARVQRLWAVGCALRGRAPEAELHALLIGCAQRSGLTAALGRHGREDVEHVVRWALLGRDPFGADQ